MSSTDISADWLAHTTVAISHRVEYLAAQLGQACICRDELRVVRLRTFGNGSKHHVMQCTGCGEQRGNALSNKAVRALLASGQGEPFDDEAHSRYSAKRRALSEEHTAMHSLWLSRERPDLMPSLTAQREADEARARNVKAAISQCVSALSREFEEDQTADALAKEAIAIRRRHWNARLESAVRFKSESELKTWLVDHLSEDFVLMPEVAGKHMAEGVRVQIDYVAYPKPHLIEAGFAPHHFGIEVKYLDQTEGFSHKASRGIWQTVSYTDSQFLIDQQWRPLKFALFFSNLAFEQERGLLENLGAQSENDRVTWRALLQLANHATVGTFEILGDRHAWQGWKMAFSNGTYFTRKMRAGKAVHLLSNANMINKVRIGNF